MRARKIHARIEREEQSCWDSAQKSRPNAGSGRAGARARQDRLDRVQLEEPDASMDFCIKTRKERGVVGDVCRRSQ